MSGIELAMSPVPPCPECGHAHRFGGCARCKCTLWSVKGDINRYYELLRRGGMTDAQWRERARWIDAVVGALPGWEARRIAAKQWELTFR